MNKMLNKTLDYYHANAASFAADTVSVDFSETADRFLQHIPQGGTVLDFGCGSGRDTKYFLEKGYRVTAVDGSEELCRLASAITGIRVHRMLFEELEDEELYDGIWACASVLHLAETELPDVMARMYRALKRGGIIYLSFKYGTFSGMRGGRYFTDFTEQSFKALLDSLRYPEKEMLQIREQWTSLDVRPGRENDRWLNILLQKQAYTGEKEEVSG